MTHRAVTGSCARATAALALAILLGGCWLQSGYGPERNGFNPAETTLIPSTVSSLRQSWSVRLGGAVTDPIVSTAGVHAVAGNTVTTVSPATGAPQWSATLFPAGLPGPAVVGPAAVMGNRLFVPVDLTTNLSGGSGVHAFDAKTGSAQGIVAPGGDATVRGTSIVSTTYDVFKPDLVSTYLGASDLAGPGSSWRGFIGTERPTSATVTADEVLIGLGPNLLAFPFAAPDCSDTDGLTVCVPTWSRPLGAPVVGDPVSSPDGTTVLAAVGTDLWALRTTSGETLWHGVLGAAATAAPATDGTTVFVPTADGDLETFALGGCGATALCTTRWRGITGSSISVQPALAGGVVYTGSANGAVRAFTASGCGAATTCAASWSKRVGSAVTGAPAVTDARLYVGTAAGRLVSFSPGGA